MALLGLTNTNDLAAHASANVRRKVFYQFPNGGAPMTGLLSMANTANTDKAEWGWYEKRDPNQRAILGRYSATKGAFGTDTTTAVSATQAVAADATLYVKFKNATEFGKIRIGHHLWFRDIPGDGSTLAEFYGIVIALDTGTNTAQLRFTAASANDIDNDTTDWDAAGDVDKWGAHIVGSAHAEGSGAGTGIYNLPELSENYTQIFKTAFSSTGTSLKEGMKWDDTGHYQDKMWEAARQHAKEIEYAAIFGVKHKNTANFQDADGGAAPLRTTKGVYSFLRDWDTAAGATLDTDPNKRIINNTAGTISYKTYNGYMARLFAVTNDRNFEKICFCGSGHIGTVNEMLDNRATINTTFLGDEKFKFRVVEVTTIAGTVYYHTHPLFSNNPELTYDGLYIDVNNINMVPLNDRDTQIQEEIQANDADYRKDQFLTEIGVENVIPESHMYIRNLQSVA